VEKTLSLKTTHTPFMFYRRYALIKTKEVAQTLSVKHGNVLAGVAPVNFKRIWLSVLPCRVSLLKVITG